MRAFVADVSPPGNLYDVGGHKLHLDCRGQKNGNPTIVFESGAATPSPVYQHLAENLSKTHKFCMYDRAGLAWSEASGVPSETPAITEQLHALLIAANIEKPFVLAGHSIAGLYMKSYIKQYPQDVAAVAFFDALRDSITYVHSFVSSFVRFCPKASASGPCFSLKLI